MKKKFLTATFVVAIMTVAGFNVYMNQAKSDLSEMALANIEALADPEFDENKKGEVQLKCNVSTVVKCETTCPKCYAKWFPPYNKYGVCTDVRGTCSCGNKF